MKLLHVELIKYADVLKVNIELPGILEKILKCVPFVYIKYKRVKHSSLEYHWQYQNFRRVVFKLSGFKCIVCGAKHGEKKLTVHHLFSPLSKFYAIALDHDFSVCMCVDCHQEFNLKYGHVGNTPEQFYEFLGFKQHMFGIQKIIERFGD